MQKLPVVLKVKSACRLKCAWDGKSYVWSHWTGKWSVIAKVDNAKPVFDGLRLGLGINRGRNLPLLGTINLNVSYIVIDGKLWWEGVKGARTNAGK